jgi:hypothetical protein
MGDPKTPAQRAKFYVICAIAVLVGVVLSMRALSIPELENESLCPRELAVIPQGDLNVIIDRTDALSDLNQDVVMTLVSKWADGAIPFQRMNIYVLNSGDIKTFSKQLTVCAPPREISLQIARGRTSAKKLLEAQKNYVADAISRGIKVSEPINKSRIIEAIRQVTNSSWPPKSKLILISDLIEISDLADFYFQMAPEFETWQAKAKGAVILNEIMLTQENKVQICELQTDKPDHAHRGAARVFWQKFFFQYGIAVKASCSEVLI